ncbi:twin-arginine translocation signal domain-containing protein [Natronococcus sp. A-GB1]|nr:twin-arginine translocation signal domain-containing protein [Natronococcus sp. A-GB1]MDG5760082.1 twin-arginine translocation signal domain-containing protein [Natronococcus sp. A-GB1]
MKRRQFLSTTLAATGVATIAGCSGTGDLDGDDG